MFLNLRSSLVLSIFWLALLGFSLQTNAIDLHSNIRNAHQQGRDEQKYFADMDASFALKWDLILPAIEDYEKNHTPLRKICDVGTGTGLLAAKLAAHFLQRNIKIIGTDIMHEYVTRANTTFSLPNLFFRYRSTEDTCVKVTNNNGKKPGANIVIFSSVLHEAYSYGGDGDSDESLRRALNQAWLSLEPKGRMLIRDFIAPEDGHRQIILHHQISDIKSAELAGTKQELTCSNFAQDFKAIKNKQFTTRKDVFCQEFSPCATGYKCYKTNLATAFEFIYRKDFNDSYGAELNERYGFTTANKARDMVEDAGFQLISLTTFLNPWITRHRLDEKIHLIDEETSMAIPFPDYQMFLVAQKP